MKIQKFSVIDNLILSFTVYFTLLANLLTYCDMSVQLIVQEIVMLTHLNAQTNGLQMWRFSLIVCLQLLPCVRNVFSTHTCDFSLSNSSFDAHENKGGSYNLLICCNFIDIFQTNSSVLDAVSWAAGNASGRPVKSPALSIARGGSINFWQGDEPDDQGIQRDLSLNMGSGDFSQAKLTQIIAFLTIFAYKSDVFEMSHFNQMIKTPC